MRSAVDQNVIFSHKSVSWAYYTCKECTRVKIKFTVQSRTYDTVEMYTNILQYKKQRQYKVYNTCLWR